MAATKLLPRAVPKIWGRRRFGFANAAPDGEPVGETWLANAAAALDFDGDLLVAHPGGDVAEAVFECL